MARKALTYQISEKLHNPLLSYTDLTISNLGAPSGSDQMWVLTVLWPSRINTAHVY